MTRERDHTETETSRRTMGEISHTNPYTGGTAGHPFYRGPTVTPDGGRTKAQDESEQTMKDVSHTPSNDFEDLNRVFERGRRPREHEEE